MSLLTNLVAYWKLEDVNDSHTGGYTLTNNNSVTFTSGKVNNAARFASASSKYLSRADDAVFRPGNFDFTWALWFNVTSAGVQTILGYDYNVTRGYQFLYGSAGANTVSFALNHAGGGATATASGISLSTWYLAFFWHDAAGDTVNLKVNDGTTVSVSTGGNAPNASHAGLSVGRDNYPGFAQYMNGQVDELAYWTGIPTAGEMTQYYNGGNGTNYPFGSPIKALLQHGVYC